ncbi:MAG: hypothetical protein ACXWV8_02210 [Chitinophagaceae bacterium]
MSEIQTRASNISPSATASQPGIFGTKIPSSVAFGIGVLLFFMPFLDIKCNTMILQKVSGVQLATGFEIKSPGAENTLVGSLEKMDKGDVKVNKGEKKEPNLWALAALILGVIGLVLSLLNAKAGGPVGVITGILAAVALIATMIDVKSKLQAEMPGLQKRARGESVSGFDKLGDSIYIAVDFTPWFYIAIISFLVAAFFCYKRMQETRL